MGGPTPPWDLRAQLASVSLFLYGRILIPVIMMLVLAVFSAEVFHSARRGARKIVFVVRCLDRGCLQRSAAKQGSNSFVPSLPPPQYVFLVGLIAGISIVYASALSPIQYTSCSLYDNKETCTSLTSAWSQIFVFASIALALEAATLGFVGCVVVVRDDPTPEDLWLGA